MNTDTLKGNWNELKGKIRAKWGKFSEDDVESFKGNLDQISGKIQQHYGYAKERAEQEYNEFKQTLAGKANDKMESAGVVDSDRDDGPLRNELKQ